jgi:hypothetical protein
MDKMTISLRGKGEARHTCLAHYYTKHPELNVVPLILKDDKEVIADWDTLNENAKKAKAKKKKGNSPRKCQL